MRRIAIGNDFRVSWTLTQLGEAFNVVGKTFDIEVSTAYGVIVVNDVVSEGNVLSFNIPASGQVYTGNYDIRLHITDEQTEQKWRLKQCDAFALVPCDCGEIVEVVQFASGIVYPANGLDAYQLAVASGEYTGDYEGYQRWLARYAENTANDAVNIANEANSKSDVANENSSKALILSQEASVVANDSKTAIATKQDALTLTVKDNGNIVIGNIQGQTKEFMPATPSGDPNHYMYEKCGAVWNGNTGYWELNGLTDMTNEDMQDSYLGCNMYSDVLLAPEKYMSKCFRTNILGNVRFIATVSANSAAQTFRDNSYLEVLNLQLFNGTTHPLCNFTSMSYCFDRCIKLNTILGIIKCTKASFNMTFNRCYELTNIKLSNVSNAISFADSPKLSKESLLYLINNADTATFTVTLHADTYTWASTDTDIQAALAIKTDITLQST